MVAGARHKRQKALDVTQKPSRNTQFLGGETVHNFTMRVVLNTILSLVAKKATGISLLETGRSGPTVPESRKKDDRDARRNKFKCDIKARHSPRDQDPRKFVDVPAGQLSANTSGRIGGKTKQNTSGTSLKVPFEEQRLLAQRSVRVLI